METLDNKTQLIAVEKVLEEMQKAEEYIKNWHAYWWEQLLDAHCLPLHYEIGEADVSDMERKYEPRYKLANAFYSNDSIGIPLAKETLVGNNTLTGEKSINFECEFGRIDWYAMHSNKATRYFSFNNNGIIKFSKSTKTGKGPTLKHPNRISYDTSFNVLSNDFDISITLNQLTGDLGKKYKYDYLLLSLKDNILIEKFNDIEIIRNLSTRKKVVRIIKKRDRTMPNYSSVVFEAALNPDNILEFGNVIINTYKANGKVNGTYRFDASRKKGICANFYSRKGIKIDLINNPDLLNTANALLLPTPSNQNSGDIIVSNFVNATQNAIAKNSSEKVISFDNFDFNIEAIQQAETKIIEIVKCIKGELPLFGLVERINNCLNLIDRKKQLKVTTKSKTLKPELPNN